MIETRIVPATRDLGDGLRVRRALPAGARRSVGPFVFFDEMGPMTLAAGQGLDVRPHPHIGLATVTYLFAGEIEHRDSLGTVRTIRPGEVNWMIAGRGIVHSERSPAAARTGGERLWGLQTWVALPVEREEMEPAFSHHAALPLWEDGGISVRVILGDLYGLASPVPTLSPTFYAEVALPAARRIALPNAPDERAIYVLEGEATAGGAPAARGEMLVFAPGAQAVVASAAGARLVMFGGAALDVPREVWWNFVSSRPERIARAAGDWKEGRFPAVPGESELIPLPDRPLPVRYP